MNWRFDVDCIVSDDGAEGIAHLSPDLAFWEGEAQPITDPASLQANGKLLAAAPALLRAARLALASLEAAGFETATVEALKRAIARATEEK